MSGESADELVVVFESFVVVEAEVGVGLVSGEDVVGADEDRVGDRDDCFAVAAAAAQTQVLGLEVGVATTRGGAGALDQDLAQPRVADAGGAVAAFACRFVVAGTDAGPQDLTCRLSVEARPVK